jgi:azobenzene reductase
MRIAIVCGSVRNNSFTKILLEKIEDNFSRIDVEIDFIDFSDTPLPMFDGTEENKIKASAFIDRMKRANGFLIACPEYHNSFSGVLKNAFDYLSFEQIADKPIGLIATSGGGKGGINCLNGMRLFLRGMYGLVLPDQIVFDRNEVIENKSVEKMIDLLNKVIKYSLLTENKSLQQTL